MSAQIWLISDWHWRHENIYTFTDTSGARIRGRFADAAEGDAYIEQRWRDLVKPDHHVYNLGDCTMFRGKHQMVEFINLTKSLPGHKRLILGNHDHYDIMVYVHAGYEKIRASNMIDGLLLTHYPVHPSSISFKVKGNVHGHTHQQPDIDHRYLNVSVERTNFEPIPIEEAVLRLAEKQRLASFTTAVVDTQGNLITGP